MAEWTDPKAAGLLADFATASARYGSWRPQGRWGRPRRWRHNFAMVADPATGERYTSDPGQQPIEPPQS